MIVLSSCSILIPNLNGKDLLKKCLPSVLEATSYDSKHEIIILDMGSTDGSVEFVRAQYPNIKLVELHHLSIADALNAGLKIARNEIIISIDNDSILDKNFIPYLLKGFRSPLLFAAHAKLLRWDKSTIDGGRRQAAIQLGIFQTFGEAENEKDWGQLNIRSQVLVAEHGAFRKEILQKLGGFDSLFPIYFNRIDVCYRAWKMGYFVIFEPQSIEFHRSTSRLANSGKAKFLQTTDLEERLLFMWKNFTDSGLLIRHIVSLGPYLIYMTFKLKDPVVVFKAFMSAFRKMPAVICRRRIESGRYSRTDRDVFSLLDLSFFLGIKKLR